MAIACLSNLTDNLHPNLPQDPDVDATRTSQRISALVLSAVARMLKFDETADSRC